MLNKLRMDELFDHPMCHNSQGMKQKVDNTTEGWIVTRLMCDVMKCHGIMHCAGLQLYICMVLQFLSGESSDAPFLDVSTVCHDPQTGV